MAVVLKNTYYLILKSMIAQQPPTIDHKSPLEIIGSRHLINWLGENNISLVFTSNSHYGI